MPVKTKPEKPPVEKQAVLENLLKVTTEQQILSVVAERHLLEFVRQAWHVVEPEYAFVEGRHHEAICKHLEAVTNGDIRNLIINVPPRHTKSLIVSVMWPAWVWTKRASLRWLFSSYAMGLSIRDSVKCRVLIQSRWYRERWGHAYSLVGEPKEKLENNRSGVRQATSVGGTGTGEGGDIIVVDDPNNIKEVESDTIREGVNHWWDNVMPTRLNDPKKSARVIIMQRSHENDLSGHIKQKGNNIWEWLVLPAEFERESRCVTKLGDADWRTKEGELLWPERFGKPELDALKIELGSYGTAGQLQQRPAPAGGGIFKRHWWQFYMQRPDTFDSVFQSWDMSFKDTKGSDYVSGGVWGVKGANMYLLDRFNERMDFVETCKALRTMTAKWPKATAKYVEDKANGPAVISSLRNEIPGIIAVNPDGGKIARAYAAQPLVEAGNVWLPHPSIAPWVDEYVHELCTFPSGAHDDDVDMTTQAIKKARDPIHHELPDLVSLTRQSAWTDTGSGFGSWRDDKDTEGNDGY